MLANVNDSIRARTRHTPSCCFRLFFHTFSLALEGIHRNSNEFEVPNHFRALFPGRTKYDIDMELNLTTRGRQMLRKQTIQEYCQSSYRRHDYRTDEIIANQYSIFPQYNVSECRVTKTG